MTNIRFVVNFWHSIKVMHCLKFVLEEIDKLTTSTYLHDFFDMKFMAYFGGLTIWILAGFSNWLLFYVSLWLFGGRLIIRTRHDAHLFIQIGSATSYRFRTTCFVDVFSVEFNKLTGRGVLLKRDTTLLNRFDVIYFDGTYLRTKPNTYNVALM